MTKISTGQRRLHVASEVVALAVVAPFFVYVGTRPTLPIWARAVAWMGAVGTVAVDGYLLTRFLRVA